MSECDRIADQIERAFRGGAWHGPAVLELLEGVDAVAASARPVTGAHSIWELTHHIAAWKRIATRRIAGGRAVRVPDAEDWPPVPEPSASAWTAAVEALKAAQDALVAGVRALGEDRLELVGPGAEEPNYRLLHGVVQHDLYHAGQIALLKKKAASG